jgi:hypothetical protein
MEDQANVSSSDPDWMSDDFNAEGDICRVCRMSGDGTLYFPCKCAGSIKYVHQECLLQWLKYSKKEVCELCNHKFTFQPVYSEDMPEKLPMTEIAKGELNMKKRVIARNFRCIPHVRSISTDCAHIFSGCFLLVRYRPSACMPNKSDGLQWCIQFLVFNETAYDLLFGQFVDGYL